MTSNPAFPSRDDIMRAVAATFLALSFFVLGCLVVENDVNYPAWRTLPPPELMQHHAAIETGLTWTMFPAMAVHLLLGIALLIRPFPQLGRRAAGLIVAAFAAVLIVSFALVVPLHIEIGASGAQETVEAIISRHRLFRWPLEALAAVASFAGLLRLLR
jgi:succinate dehydrogenase hydrophobic anchor subunit